MARDLVPHGTFDRPERVDVLRLGALAPLGGAAWRDRHVDVAAQGPLLHAHVGHAQRAQQVPQLRDVRAGDLGRVRPGPGHRLGDDLDERDARAVVVDQRVHGAVDAAGRAADVQRLAGVLLHVRALDAHCEHLRPAGRVDPDVERPLERDRLVVLRDLVVLRHVRIEVVLPREAAPRRDLAPQGQADPHCRLDRALIQDRQRAGQAQADGAHLRVGLGAEDGRAAAEHLRRGRQLDVDLEAQHRLVPGDRVLVRDERGDGHSSGASSSNGPPHRSTSAASSTAPTR